MTSAQAALHLLHRLSGDDAAALDVLLRALADHQQLQTLGGPPPPYNDTRWTNRRVGAGVHPDYQGRL